MHDRTSAPGGLAVIEALVNTLDLETGADSLDTPAGRAPFGLTAREVPAARELREALRATLLAHAGHSPRGAAAGDAAAGRTSGRGRDVGGGRGVGGRRDVGGGRGVGGRREVDGGQAAPPLADLLARAPLLVTVDETDGTADVRAADPSSLTARVAAAIAVAAADGTWTRLKACEAADCHWAYYDRSPAGRRRWCSMAVCGSRAKMRTYRSRRGAT